MDWNFPQLTSNYTDVISLFNQRDTDTATMFDSTTSTNLPTGTIKWNSSNGRFEKWSGTAWGELISTYNINVATLDGYTPALLPISTATQTALNLKAPSESPAFTGNISGITKSMVGLGNVLNVASYSKTEENNLLSAKAPSNSPILTGTPQAPTQNTGDNSLKLANTAFVTAADSILHTALTPIFSNVTNGFYIAPKDTNGRSMIIQWGILTHTQDTQDVTLPMAFPNACLGGQGTLYYSASPINSNIRVYNLTPTTITLYNDGGAQGYATAWLVIGY